MDPAKRARVLKVLNNAHFAINVGLLVVMCVGEFSQELLEETYNLLLGIVVFTSMERVRRLFLVEEGDD